MTIKPRSTAVRCDCEANMGTTGLCRNPGRDGYGCSSYDPDTQQTVREHTTEAVAARAVLDE